MNEINEAQLLAKSTEVEKLKSKIVVDPVKTETKESVKVSVKSQSTEKKGQVCVIS